MQNLEIKNVDCHATLAMIEKRWGFPRRNLLALLGMTKSGQSGRSMIEMLGVLAIIGVLSVGGIAGYSKAMMKYRTNKTIEQITLIAGNVRAFFASQGNYADLDYGDGTRGSFVNNILRKAKLIPDEMWEGNSIKNVFGNQVFFYDEKKNDNDTSGAFEIIFYAIATSSDSPAMPVEACIELASQDWTVADVKAIGISSMKCSYGYKKPPLSIDEATERCSCVVNDTGAGGSTANMSFLFDIDVNSTYWQNQLN